MCVILLLGQKTSTRPNIYARLMNILTWILKELLNNNMFSSMSIHMLYFKCRSGHMTQCDTPKHHFLFCKECNAIITKKECDRFTDNTSQLEQRNRKNSKKVKYDGKILYQFPESSRRYYPRKKKESIPE